MAVAELYNRIAEAIRASIIAEHLKPHSRLPSEPDLARRHGAARETVRRALASLADQGVIYRRRGAGSFVAEARVEQDLDQLFSFTEFISHMGLRPESRLLQAGAIQIADSDSPVLHALQLKPGARLIYIRRLRLGSGEPLVVANTWLPEAPFRGFLKHDLNRHSVYEIMQRMGRKPMHAVQTIEASTVGDEEAKLLTVQPGSPALLIRRTGYAGSTPVEYAVDTYRGDRTRFRVKLESLARG
jgi:GntR family transcriptional regulator